MEYHVAYEHNNSVLGSDCGNLNLKRRTVDEHKSIDFLLEILRIDYCSLKSGGLAFWTKYVDSPHSVTDKFVYERFYAKFLAKEAFRVTNDLMGGDPWPSKEKRARVPGKQRLYMVVGRGR